MRIERGKTAMSRNNFSRPVQHALHTGLISKKRSVFDYGCGRGDDVAGLVQLGFDAAGWDPEHRPDTEKTAADVVNLGFVLNVIEAEQERLSAVKSAWGLAKKAMIVTVISKHEMPKASLTEYRDGHVTRRRTFQKYYEPGEIKEYVERELGVQVVPATPHMVICFRDPELEQEYLARSEAPVSVSLRKLPHPIRLGRLIQCVEDYRTRHTDGWQQLEDYILTYACLPLLAQVAHGDTLARCGVREDYLLPIFVEQLGTDDWSALEARVRNRLISRIALSFFRGDPKPRYFTANDRHVIRQHFGSFNVLKREARHTLISIGDPSAVTSECNNSTAGVKDEQALFVHRSCLPELSATLQTYVGIGRLFYGDLGGIDIFKIHKTSGKLSLFIYDDFEQSVRPLLHSRIKINFRTRRIDYYDHSEEKQTLDGKHSYLC